MGCSSSVPSVVESVCIKDRYELRSVIGEGSYAQVRVGVDRHSGEHSAVKVLDLQAHAPSAAGLSKSARDEVALWRLIGCHQNCMHLIDYFESQSQLCFVMERCESSLEHGFAKVHGSGPLELARIIREMLLGIDHLHAKSIVHRDVQPSSFFLGGSSGSTVKLSGFGFATLLPKSGSLSGACGTPAYMSPEMAADLPYASGTDVWSIGIVVSQLLCGRSPLGSRSAMLADVRRGATQLHFEQAASVPPVSTQAMSFVQRLLERSPQRRPSTNEALQHPFVCSPSASPRGLESKCNPRSICTVDSDAVSTCSSVSTQSLSLAFSEDDAESVKRDLSGSSVGSISSMKISAGKVRGLSSR